MTDTAKTEEKSVIVLVRVSTESQATEDKGGIPAQQAACKEICARHGLTPRWWITIEGVSGAQVFNSPKMKEVVRIVESGKCHGLVIKEDSRLMRPDDYRDYAIIQTLAEHGVWLYLENGPGRDLSSDEGRFTTHIYLAMAARERSQIKKRMRDGARAKRSRGEWVSGPNSVPFGFTIHKDARKFKLLQVDPAKIGKVQRLFKLFTEGTCSSFTELSRLTGVPYFSVKYILQNEIYAGVHVPRKVADPKRSVYREDGSLRYVNRRIIPVEERERIPILENPPVSPEVFARAQALLALKESTRSRPNPAGKDDPFLYRGFLRCAECKRNVTTVRYVNRQANNFRAEYYVCKATHGACTLWDKEEKKFQVTLQHGTCTTRRMRREELERQLDAVVRDRLSRPDFLEYVIQGQSDNDPEEYQRQQENLHAEVKATEDEINRTLLAWQKGRVTLEWFEREDDRLKKNLALAKRALQAIKPEPPKISTDGWKAIANEFRRWDKIGPARKRRLLLSISPTFEVAGYAGERYHQTEIKVPILHLMGFTDEDRITVKLNVA